MECSFQTNNKELLKNHVNFKHSKDKSHVVFHCDTCQNQYTSKWSLNNHIRDDHGQKEECSHFKENRCKFGKSCWKIHTKVGTTNSNFTCYTCKETFSKMNELMSHRKKKHIEYCKTCEPKNRTCRFENMPERCWFVHVDFCQPLKNQVPP